MRIWNKNRFEHADLEQKSIQKVEFEAKIGIASKIKIKFKMKIKFQKKNQFENESKIRNEKRIQTANQSGIPKFTDQKRVPTLELPEKVETTAKTSYSNKAIC